MTMKPSLSDELNRVSTDADSHAGPHHKDSTSGAESCCHTCPARFCPVTTPAYSRNGNHIYHQTRITDRPHQPAGGQQADKSELRARATGLQERYGGKSSISPRLPGLCGQCVYRAEGTYWVWIFTWGV